MERSLLTTDAGLPKPVPGEGLVDELTGTQVYTGCLLATGSWGVWRNQSIQKNTSHPWEPGCEWGPLRHSFLGLLNSGFLLS